MRRCKGRCRSRGPGGHGGGEQGALARSVHRMPWSKQSIGCLGGNRRCGRTALGCALVQKAQRQYRGALVQRCRGGSVHLARDPERSGAVAEAVVDARLPGARMQGVGLAAAAGGVWWAVCGGVCVRGSPPNLYGRPRLRRSACLYLSGEAALLLGGRARMCEVRARYGRGLALTSCVMSLTMLRASRRTAPSFPFSHASYSCSESESDLLADSILRAQPRSALTAAPPSQTRCGLVWGMEMRGYLVVSDQVIRENPASRGTEASTKNAQLHVA